MDAPPRTPAVFDYCEDRAAEIVETELGEVRSVTSTFTFRMPDGAGDGREGTERFDPADHYRLEVEHFADCVENNETARLDRTESVAHARVLGALFESASEGRPVAVGSD